MAVIKFSALLEAYRDCRRQKRSSYYCMEFDINYQEELYKLYLEINNNKYNISKSIAFLITSPRVREVFCASFRDRVVHHLLINRIDRYLESEFTKNNFACRKGKGIKYGVNCLYNTIKELSNNYTRRVDVLIIDYKNFFMSMDKSIMTKIMTEFLHNNIDPSDPNRDAYIKLFNKIINNKPQENCTIKGRKDNWRLLAADKSLFKSDTNKGLPIGDLTSQKSGGLYMDDIDHKCLNEFGDDCGRYVDDSYFVVLHTPTSIAELKLFIKELDEYSWRTRRIHLNMNKVRIHNGTDRIKYLGMELMPWRILPITRTINNLRTKLSESSKLSNPTSDYLINLNNSINSSLGILRQGSTYRIRKSLLNKSKYPILNHFNIINYDKIKLCKID